MTSLTKELMHVTQGKLDTTAPSLPNVANELVSRPGRAFKHLITGKFLAESGSPNFLVSISLTYIQSFSTPNTILSNLVLLFT